MTFLPFLPISSLLDAEKIRLEDRNLLFEESNKKMLQDARQKATSSSSWSDADMATRRTDFKAVIDRFQSLPDASKRQRLAIDFANWYLEVADVMGRIQAALVRFNSALGDDKSGADSVLTLLYHWIYTTDSRRVDLDTETRGDDLAATLSKAGVNSSETQTVIVTEIRYYLGCLHTSPEGSDIQYAPQMPEWCYTGCMWDWLWCLCFSWWCCRMWRVRTAVKAGDLSAEDRLLSMYPFSEATAKESDKARAMSLLNWYKKESKPQFDYNSYATKSTLSQGVMKISLLAINIAQLKLAYEHNNEVLSTGRGKLVEYHLIAMLWGCVALQVLLGVLLFILAVGNVENDSTSDDTEGVRTKADMSWSSRRRLRFHLTEQERMNILNNFTGLLVFVLTVLEVAIIALAPSYLTLIKPIETGPTIDCVEPGCGRVNASGR